MSYKIQEFIFSVSLADVQIGVKIGYEVEFSVKPSFVPITYRLSTYEERKGSLQGTFYYSLDNGVTWIDFPKGEQGYAFTTAYKIKVIINSADASYLYCEKRGTIYRITGDASEVVEQYDIDTFNSTGFEIDRLNNLYISGQNKTLYKIDTSSTLCAGDNSLNIHSNPLGIAIDGTRNLLWQVDRKKVYSKDLYGNEIFSL